MKSDVEIRESLRRWIAAKSGKITAEELRDDTPIIEKRIISSVQVMDLILYLEELREQPVDVQSLRPGNFRDIDAIMQNFFGEY